MKKLLIALLAISFYGITTLYTQEQYNQDTTQKQESNEVAEDNQANGKDFYYACSWSAGAANENLYLEYTNKEECKANCPYPCIKVNQPKEKFDTYQDTAWLAN